MPANPENPGISPAAIPDASAPKATDAAPPLAPAPETKPHAKATKATPKGAVVPPKAKVIVPQPAPPPPDTRTPEELESIAMEFLAGGPGPTATAAPQTPEAASPNPDATGTPTPAEEPQEGEPETPGTSLEPPPESSGPEWLVTALDAVPEGALPSWLPDRLLKIAKHDAARNAQLKALEGELAAAKQSPPVVAEATAADPLASITTESGLQQAVTNAQAWEDWCEMNPEGGLLDTANEESYLDADTVRANRIHARRILRAEPAKREWLKQYQATAAAVVRERPGLSDKASPDFLAAVDLLSRPLAARPDHLQIVADYLAGKQAREDKAKGIQTVKLHGNGSTGSPQAARPAARAAAPSGAAPAAPVRSAGAPEDITALRHRAKEGDEAAANKLAAAFLETAA